MKKVSLMIVAMFAAVSLGYGQGNNVEKSVPSGYKKEIQVVKVSGILTRVIPAQTESEVKNKTAPEIKGYYISAPVNATFYSNSTPEKSPYVKVGDVVEKEQTICHLKDDKTNTEIISPVKCEILEILKQSGYCV